MEMEIVVENRSVLIGTAYRKTCLDCTRKHIGAAYSYFESFRLTRKSWDFYMGLGNLMEAVSESGLAHPVLSERIQNAMLQIMVAPYGSWVNLEAILFQIVEAAGELEDLVFDPNNSKYMDDWKTGFKWEDVDVTQIPDVEMFLVKAAQAHILMIEVYMGYPPHRWIAVGHLNMICSELMRCNFEIANAIRCSYLALAKGHQNAWEYFQKESPLAVTLRAFNIPERM